jgi:hypothetical protein
MLHTETLAFLHSYPHHRPGLLQKPPSPFLFHRPVLPPLHSLVSGSTPTPRSSSRPSAARCPGPSPPLSAPEVLLRPRHPRPARESSSKLPPPALLPSPRRPSIELRPRRTSVLQHATPLHPCKPPTRRPPLLRPWRRRTFLTGRRAPSRPSPPRLKAVQRATPPLLCSVSAPARPSPHRAQPADLAHHAAAPGRCASSSPRHGLPRHNLLKLDRLQFCRLHRSSARLVVVPPVLLPCILGGFVDICCENARARVMW